MGLCLLVGWSRRTWTWWTRSWSYCFQLVAARSNHLAQPNHLSCQNRLVPCQVPQPTPLPAEPTASRSPSPLFIESCRATLIGGVVVLHRVFDALFSLIQRLPKFHQHS